MTRSEHILSILLGLSLIAGGFFVWKTVSLSGSLESARQEVQELTQSLLESTDRADTLETDLNETNEKLSESENTREQLATNLQEEEERNDAFEEQIEEITGTVGTLDKLAKLDEELLAKYSKVYFLNENYQPDRLSEIEEEYLYNENSLEYIHRNVEPFLNDMLEEAADDDINIWVVSAYRSFDEQAALKDGYTVIYGEGANTFSADQGYSEHQLGTAVDFTTTGLGGGFQGLENTEAYTWLLENAHEYGFILSYPEDNQFYIFEPWHWRFVGTELAEYLHDTDQEFYDLDQRDINEYLISIFD